MSNSVRKASESFLYALPAESACWRLADKLDFDVAGRLPLFYSLFGSNR